MASMTRRTDGMMGNMESMMRKGRAMMILSGVTHLTFLLANIVTDGVLIYRMYIIWGSRKRFIIGPIVISLASNVVGIVAVSVQLSANLTSFVDGNYLFMWFTGAVAFTQLVLTFMTAGRIWWISRSIAQDSSMRKSVRTIIAITLESGVIYATLLVIYQVQNSILPISIDLGLYPILIQVAGMSPTVIIIRAGLGVSIENNTNGTAATPLSPLAFAQRTTETPVTVQLSSRLTFNGRENETGEKTLRSGEV
ncbi:hypothetical protein PQX77_012148 [Marasmius sp. AFHP31]|nr:hypothetical protein PQX77_012148 [Marasmius sp. AFHP31]